MKTTNRDSSKNTGLEMRIGLGYDIHRFVKGRGLILGGVDIPYEQGLDGHSDADVLVHAICDALLGALGKGDIGEHFPNSDETYRNISSLKLLNKVHTLTQAEGYEVNNIDTVVIAQEPNLKAYKKVMGSRIAAELAIAESAVNIKATTPEGIGGLGRKEGVAAYATVLLRKKKV